MDGSRGRPANSRSLFDPPEQESDRSERGSGTVKILVAHIDGGARGNPGPAGYGVHLADDKGALVAEISRYLGHRTNNFAEYSALIAALEYAVEHGWDALKAISDSELLVKQIRGEYKVKSPDLKELYDRARILIRKLARFSIQHVLREKNRDADRLANWAMDNPALCGSTYVHDRTRGARAVTTANQATANSSSNKKELRGIVRGGKIELLDGELPDGARVRVIVSG
jgi:ribonuclease HI